MESRLPFALLFACALGFGGKEEGGGIGKYDTSTWVGAQYQPSQSSNEDWWWHYDHYEKQIQRELTLVKKALNFTAIRVFLHSLIYKAHPPALLEKMHKFLEISSKNDLKVGFVFFDDCWNHQGLNLSEPCLPRKGVHNGCWMASPQDIERTTDESKIQETVNSFKAYVTDIVNEFRQDTRVVWWEIFNEPNVDPTVPLPEGNFSNILRQSAYAWITELNPTQPILSCWDENNATQINDHHQYSLPWNAEKNEVFANFSGRMKGGIVTEAGARWYPGYEDAGNPLTVIDWLSKLRMNPNALFVPGVMINWEVMVSNSNTRWHWGSAEDSSEPAIPWHQHIYPDGSPVSYTEAATIRRYISEQSSYPDIFFLESFLNSNPNPNSDERYLTLSHAGSNSSNVFKTPVVSQNQVLLEAAIRPMDGAERVEIYLLYNNSDRGVLVSVDVSTTMLEVSSSESESVQFNLSVRENGLLPGAWNLIRVRLTCQEIEVWMNPMVTDVYPDGIPMPGEKNRRIIALPPILKLRSDCSGYDALSANVVAKTGTWDLDYLSILKPILYGESFTP
ncbi:hypothetical protein AAMO2058_001428600 [Amorphochlora amoebiformis]